MNTIKKITLVQFKNYASASFPLNNAITCITGPNGSGKTNLLDAVYYLCYTKSYFSSYQQYNVQHGTDGFRLEGVFNNGTKEEVISCKWKGGKKEIAADGTEYEKVSDHIGKYAAVIIAPDDMELINDGSELRRKWMDSVPGQVDRRYLDSLMQYYNILLQRNAWLKLNSLNPPSENAELEYYNQQLSLHGTYIHEQRKIFIEEFRPLLLEFYQQLSGGKEAIGISYQSDIQKQSLIQWLEQGFEHDLRLQRTLRGIHKDDLLFTFNDTDLKQYGSQGQKKTYLFALKLAQYAYIGRKHGHPPVLLLDDIFEKLDQDRIKALLRIIRNENFGQVILTDTHAERVKEAFGDQAEISFISVT